MTISTLFFFSCASLSAVQQIQYNNKEQQSESSVEVDRQVQPKIHSDFKVQSADINKQGLTLHFTERDLCPNDVTIRHSYTGRTSDWILGEAYGYNGFGDPHLDMLFYTSAELVSGVLFLGGAGLKAHLDLQQTPDDWSQTKKGILAGTGGLILLDIALISYSKLTYKKNWKETTAEIQPCSTYTAANKGLEVGIKLDTKSLNKEIKIANIGKPGQYSDFLIPSKYLGIYLIDQYDRDLKVVTIPITVISQRKEAQSLLSGSNLETILLSQDSEKVNYGVTGTNTLNRELLKNWYCDGLHSTEGNISFPQKHILDQAHLLEEVRDTCGDVYEREQNRMCSKGSIYLKAMTGKFVGSGALSDGQIADWLNINDSLKIIEAYSNSCEENKQLVDGIATQVLDFYITDQNFPSAQKYYNDFANATSNKWKKDVGNKLADLDRTFTKERLKSLIYDETSSSRFVEALKLIDEKKDLFPSSWAKKKFALVKGEAKKNVVSLCKENEFRTATRVVEGLKEKADETWIKRQMKYIDQKRIQYTMEQVKIKQRRQRERAAEKRSKCPRFQRIMYRYSTCHHFCVDGTGGEGPGSFEYDMCHQDCADLFNLCID